MNKVKCGFCGSLMNTVDEKCPSCGAVNTNYVRTSDDTPKTIEELQEWCNDNGLDLKNMHIHLGEDYKGAKAFGIYRDGSYVTVYKNKDTGERVVRYEGYDEEYAVNELFLKIKSMVLTAKEATLNPNSSNHQYVKTDKIKSSDVPDYSNKQVLEKAKDENQKRNKSSIGKDILNILSGIFSGLWELIVAGCECGIIPIILIIGFIVFGVVSCHRDIMANGGYNFSLPTAYETEQPLNNGYFKYNEVNYYHHNQFWYYYSTQALLWDYCNKPDGITNEYYVGVDGTEEPFPTDNFSSEWVTTDNNRSNDYFIYYNGGGYNYSDSDDSGWNGSGGNYDWDYDSGDYDSGYDSGYDYGNDYDWGDGWDFGDYNGGYDSGYDYDNGCDWDSDW